MRSKIAAGNMLWVLATGLLAYFLVRMEIAEHIEAETVEEVNRGSGVFEQSFELSGQRLISIVESRARAPEFASVFSASGADSLRTRAHEAANSLASWLQDPARGVGGRPEIVVVIDETGRVVARDLAIERMYQHQISQSLPIVREVLEGGRNERGVWRQETNGKILRVAVVAIRSPEGRVIGAVMVGYDISNGFAEAQAESAAPANVGYVVDGTLYASSGHAAVLQVAVADDGALSAAVAAAGEGERSPAIAFEHDGGSYVASVGPLPGAAGVSAGLVTLVDRSAHAASTLSVSQTVLAATILMALGVMIYSFLIGGRLIRPLEDIEEGVLKVLNGQTGFRIDVEDDEFGGLAYRINQLINMLTGTAESDAEGHTSSSGEWQVPGGAPAPAPTEPQSGEPAGGADANLAARLAAEPADAYHARVYGEYVAAKQAAGEDVSNITQERFVKRLKGQEASLAQKKGCRMVRFRVVVSGEHVSLDPVLIN